MFLSELVKKLGLTPHPEGGYYRETYRAEELYEVNGIQKNCATAIYFLITDTNFSALHKIQSDEIFHFYYGDSVDFVMFDEKNKPIRKTLGTNIQEGEKPQIIVPKNMWQGFKINKTNPNNINGFCLMGATVAPGFDYKDFKLGSKIDLMMEFPEYHKIIHEFTKK